MLRSLFILELVKLNKALLANVEGGKMGKNIEKYSFLWFVLLGFDA